MNGVYVVTAHGIASNGNGSVPSDGAYINVYSTAESDAAARIVALKEIEAAGWRCLTVQRVHWSTREDYASSPDELDYFEQALIDGVVVVVHSFSRNAKVW